MLTVVARPLTRLRRWLLGLMLCAFACVLAVEPLRSFYGLEIGPPFGWLTTAAVAGAAVVALEAGWQFARRWHLAERLEPRAAQAPPQGMRKAA